ncbi:hypothetical protein ABFX02_14G160600 [Erythranthe guttata]
MEQYEREKSLIVPLIFSLFCLCVSIGGVLLVINLCFPDLSQPWQPIAAFVLIGSTWIFWILTCFYVCIKTCFRRCRCRDHQIPTALTPRNIPPASPNDGGGGHGHHQHDSIQDTSFASSTDSETPLTYAAV